MDSLGQDVVYISGRKRPPGEMNGKSGNLNNVAAQLYPKGMFVPGTELIAVFDADQVRPRLPTACRGGSCIGLHARPMNAKVLRAAERSCHPAMRLSTSCCLAATNLLHGSLACMASIGSTVVSPVICSPTGVPHACMVLPAIPGRS